MRYSVKVLGTDTVDASPTVMLDFESGRYLFNCGEGTQRFCHEHKVGIRKVDQIFLTRVAWETVGGLPGMLLTLADAGASSLTLHGPNNLTHFMAANRHFVYREALDLMINERAPSDAPYTDKNLTITAVHLLPERIQERTLKRKSEGDKDQPYANKKTVLDRMFPGSRGNHPLGSSAADEQPAPVVESTVVVSIPACAGEEASIMTPAASLPDNGALKRSEIGRLNAIPLPRSTPDPTVLAYICQGPTVPGKFNPKAAQSLGIKPGPDFGRLQRGESITAPNGTVVNPDQVLGPEKPGAVFLILDVPNTAYIASLVAATEFQSLYNAKDPVRCIVHILGDDILENPRYRDWMNKFGAKTQHLVVSRRHNPSDICFLGAGEFVSKVHQLDKIMFPLPHYTQTPERNLKEVAGLPAKTLAAAPLTEFIIEPSSKLESKDCLKPFECDPTEQIGKIAELTINEVSQTRTSQSGMADSAEAGVVIVPLGTGSAIPGRYRNVSSTFVTFPTGNVLLDAGEGTLGQLFRSYGPEGMRNAIANLKFIFLSHLHADHHLGMIRIMSYWNQIRDRQTSQPLVMVAPARYRIFLEEYSDVEDFGFEHITFVDCEQVQWKNGEPTNGADDPTGRSNGIDLLKQVMGLESVVAVRVDHCPWAYALVMKTLAGCKLVFSGDCRPSDDLIQAGHEATILIHEGTLCNAMEEEACKKKHSTIGQAIEVGQKMQTRHLLLTHFSQRYPKMPILPSFMTDNVRSTDASPAGGMTIGIAYDLMKIPLTEFWRLPILLRSGLTQMFPPDSSYGAGSDGEPDVNELPGL
ncbi:beta-lactamase-like protein [Powellomyces hirtus]|nr:beta-lactamase-like protein [Powellomyces hirtus]